MARLPKYKVDHYLANELTSPLLFSIDLMHLGGQVAAGTSQVSALTNGYELAGLAYNIAASAIDEYKVVEAAFDAAHASSTSTAWTSTTYQIDQDGTATYAADAAARKLVMIAKLLDVDTTDLNDAAAVAAAIESAADALAGSATFTEV